MSSVPPSVVTAIPTAGGPDCDLPMVRVSHGRRGHLEADRALGPHGPEVTAIMVTYRSRRTIDRALEGLHPSVVAGLIRCVVVDNASPDGTADHVAERFPWVQVLRSAVNLGYGRGCNLGASFATTPLLLFLNPDIHLDSSSIARLTELAKSHPRLGVAGPAIRRGDGRLQHAGGCPNARLSLLQSLGLRAGWGGRNPVIPGAAPRRVDWVCGAIMLVPAVHFRAVGGFDPRYFLYFEESDLCRKMLRTGRQLWVTGEAIAEHAGGASAREVDPRIDGDGCLPQHYFASRNYFLRKHFGCLAAWTIEAADIAGRATRDVARRILRRRTPKELDARRGAYPFREPLHQALR